LKIGYSKERHVERERVVYRWNGECREQFRNKLRESVNIVTEFMNNRENTVDEKVKHF